MDVDHELGPMIRISEGYLERQGVARRSARGRDGMVAEVGAESDAFGTGFLPQAPVEPNERRRYNGHRIGRLDR
jgi:hypothetical protein